MPQVAKPRGGILNDFLTYSLVSLRTTLTMLRTVLNVQELVWMVGEGDFSTEAEHVACDREGEGVSPLSLEIACSRS